MTSDDLTSPPETPGPRGAAATCRLGWYFDAVYRRSADGASLETISESYPFLIFSSAVGERVASLTLFGREAPVGVPGVDLPIAGAPRFVPLPYYESVNDIRALVRALPATARAMWRGLGEVDRVVIFGPHPNALLLALLALARRRGVVLGVRQDTLAYFRARLAGRRAAPLMAPVWVIDRISRLLSRRLRTAVVGDELEKDYGGPRPRLLMFRPTLIATRHLRPRTNTALPQEGAIELLTVGRIAPEKTPETLVRAIAALERRRPGRFHLTWVGEGDLMESTRRLAEQLGVGHAVTMAGFVPFGPRLLELYRSCDVFVHTAVTEGSPQVLIEAMASGAPIVATAVGSVRPLLDDGRAGLLVPPDDRDALVAAIERITTDETLRRSLSDHGSGLARSMTLEAEAARFAAFAAGDGPGE